MRRRGADGYGLIGLDEARGLGYGPLMGASISSSATSSCRAAGSGSRAFSRGSQFTGSTRRRPLGKHAPTGTGTSRVPGVADASALVEILLNTTRGRAAGGEVGTDTMVAPDLLNAEVLSALRRLVAAGRLDDRRALVAVDDLGDVPLVRFPTTRLVPGIWAHRHSLIPYDACYVALAEVLGCAMVTGDRRIAGAPGVQVPVITC